MARRRRSPWPAVPRTRPSRINRTKIVENLRVASRKGDRTALALAVAEMRTLANTPRYWEKYLVLLRNPIARVVDLLVIKQGERIAHLKGWKIPRVVVPEKARKVPAPTSRRARSAPPAAAQASLFD